MLEIYILIFLGILASGEIAWLPALYFGYIGELDIQTVFLIGFLATFIMDSVWYLLGRIIGSRILNFFVFKKKLNVFENFFKFFNEKYISIIFISKFFYGTRVISRILAGAHKINYARFFVITSIASFIWAPLILIVVYTVGTTLEKIENTVYNIQISFSIFVVMFIFVNLSVRKFLVGRKKSQKK